MGHRGLDSAESHMAGPLLVPLTAKCPFSQHSLDGWEDEEVDGWIDECVDG